MPSDKDGLSLVPAIVECAGFLWHAPGVFGPDQMGLDELMSAGSPTSVGDVTTWQLLHAFGMETDAYGIKASFCQGCWRN